MKQNVINYSGEEEKGDSLRRTKEKNGRRKSVISCETYKWWLEETIFFKFQYDLSFVNYFLRFSQYFLKKKKNIEIYVVNMRIVILVTFKKSQYTLYIYVLQLRHQYNVLINAVKISRLILKQRILIMMAKCILSTMELTLKCTMLIFIFI